MAAPDVKVELGLNLGTRDPFAFILDNDPRGKLDSTEFTLGGDRFFDITPRLVTTQIRRGKTQALDRIDAGVVAITVDNSDRTFDPLFEAGPYFGQLIPRRSVRITANGQPVFVGFIDDFDIQYEPGVQSVVRIDVSDAFSVLANAGLEEFTPESELSGARIEAVLDRPEVDWPEALRDIDAGNSVMLDADVSEGTPTLEYLQLVANSEFGTLFLAKDGKVSFRARNAVPNTPDLVFSDEVVDGDYTGIQFADVNIVYGSENLYNRIDLENADVFPEEAFAEDADSQIVYGPRTYSASGLLVQEPDQLQFLADFLLARYKEPQYRFETVTVVMDTLSTENQDKVLDLEIGDIVLVRFEPSDIPPAIEQYCRIIGINHDWNPASKNISFALERLDFAIFILDDPVLGVLDDDRLAYE
jgi:hypothetical protein